MNDELEGLSELIEMGEDDRLLFRRAVRELLARTYLLRGIEGEERAYDFAIRNWSPLESWFRVAGAELRKDEGLGVIAWRGWGDTKARLGREETALLLTLRVLYEERRAELNLARFPSVSVLDVVERYRALSEREIAKTRLAESLRRLAAFKLIKAPSELADPDAPILLYPSLALALDQEGIDDILPFIVAARGDDTSADTIPGEQIGDLEAEGPSTTLALSADAAQEEDE